MTPYGQTALDAEVAAVRSTGDGGRNAQLNRSAFAVAQLVAGEQVDAEPARRALIAAANDAGLDKREAESTVASGWKAGLANPRYPYRDRDGRVLYAKTRLDKPRQKYGYEHPDGNGGWKAGRGDSAAVPYRLPELLAAPRDAVIYMAEGEKHADKLASWGLVSTSHKDWQSFEFCGYVRGRTVVILPDNDEEGARCAERAARAVEAAEGFAHIVTLPRLPDKGDIIDWDGDAAELAALVRTVLNGQSWPALDLAQCAIQSAPAREWVIDGWVPANKATLVAGDGGVGKSLAAQMKATCVAMGLPFLGLRTRRTVAAYLSWEDDADELWRRQEAICAVLGIRMADLAGRLHLVSYTETEQPFLVTADADRGGARIMPLGREIERLVDQHEIGLLILDNASQIAGIDHNAVEEVAPFAHWLGTIAKRSKGAVVLLHHTNKAGDDWLGSVAYNNQFRSRLLLARPEDCSDPDMRVLSNPKANYAQRGGSVTFRWFQGAFVREEDLPADVGAELAANAQAAFENEGYLRCLAAATEAKQAVSHNKGSNYAPNIFAAMPEARGMKAKAFEQAQQRLRLLRKIRFDEPLWRGPNRVMKQGIKLSSDCTDPPARTRCIDPHEPPSQVIDITCTALHASTPLYTTYNSGGADDGPPPFEDHDIDRLAGGQE